MASCESSIHGNFPIVLSWEECHGDEEAEDVMHTCGILATKRVLNSFTPGDLKMYCLHWTYDPFDIIYTIFGVL